MNRLFPIFIKLDGLHLLIVGGHKVGYEKLSSLLAQNEHAKITLVATDICEEIVELHKKHPSVTLIQRDYHESDLAGKDIVIGAANNRDLHIEIRAKAKQLKIWVNIADDPELCDFYLSSIVTKGDLKIGISTNGKSPTLAKRIKELLQDAIPEDINSLLHNLNLLRNKLKGDFEYKVKTMNEITENWNKREE